MKLTDEQKALAGKLTHLQRMTVINHVAGGMSQRKAYFAAGGKAKTDESADSSVYQIFSKLQVRAFYDSLIEGALSDAILTRQEALGILTNISKHEEPKTQIHAIKQIADMEGWEAPKKIEGEFVVTEIRRRIIEPDGD